jgi:cytochrome P450 family 110
MVGVQRMALEISRDVILQAAIGLDPEEVDGYGPLVRDLESFVGLNATFDPAADESRLLERVRATRQVLDAALRRHVDRRRWSGARAGDDVLSTLLAAGLPDQEILDQLVTIVIAGHQTTASAIAWAFVCLHATPGALARLEEELHDAPSDGCISGLPYLQAVCLETLRLRPVVPVVSREVQRPFRLRNHTLPVGVFVTPCAYLAHRRPELFPDPETFRPERFLDPRFSPYAYFPFGGGPRRCIGMGFALVEMQIVLGVLLAAFSFEFFAPDRVRPVRRGDTIAPSGAWMRYTRRSSSRAVPGLAWPAPNRSWVATRAARKSTPPCRPSSSGTAP